MDFDEKKNKPPEKMLKPLILPQHHENGKDTDPNDLLWTGKPRNEGWDRANAIQVTQNPKPQSSSFSSWKEHLHYVFNVWESLPSKERNLPLASFPLERDLVLWVPPRTIEPLGWFQSQSGGRERSSRN